LQSSTTNSTFSKHHLNINRKFTFGLIQENGTLPMVLLLLQQQNSAVRNTIDPTAQIMPITTETPSKPNIVYGFGGSGSGGGTGQLDSQSTQLQAGTSCWRKKTHSK
jgi:hypothetical protein